jgi:hypothetical protein
MYSGVVLVGERACAIRSGCCQAASSAQAGFFVARKQKNLTPEIRIEPTALPHENSDQQRQLAVYCRRRESKMEIPVQM